MYKFNPKPPALPVLLNINQSWHLINIVNLMSTFRLKHIIFAYWLVWPTNLTFTSTISTKPCTSSKNILNLTWNCKITSTKSFGSQKYVHGIQFLVNITVDTPKEHKNWIAYQQTQCHQILCKAETKQFAYSKTISWTNAPTLQTYSKMRCKKDGWIEQENQSYIVSNMTYDDTYQPSTQFCNI